MALPPDPLPPLSDPAYEMEPGPYSTSGLRSVVGSKTNPYAYTYYKDRNYLSHPFCPEASCANPNMEIFLGDVSGFDPHSKAKQAPRETWPLTSVIARLDARPGKMPFDLPEMTYFVDYSSFHSRPLELPSGPLVETIKERLFPEKSRLVLTFYNDERLKEALWTSHSNFFEQPFLDQFDAILMPDYRAYCNIPTADYLIGERQQQILVEQGAENGRNVIPSIVWASRESLRRQADFWLSQYPRVHTIRVDCYGYNVNKTNWAWRHIYAIEKHLQGQDHIHWIITGLTSSWTIRELNRIFPKKNYSLVAPVNTFIAALRGTTDPLWSAHDFRRRIAQLEDFRMERVVAEIGDRPKLWPTFPEVDTANIFEQIPGVEPEPGIED